MIRFLSAPASSRIIRIHLGKPHIRCLAWGIWRCRDHEPWRLQASGVSSQCKIPTRSHLPSHAFVLTIRGHWKKCWNPGAGRNSERLRVNFCCVDVTQIPVQVRRNEDVLVLVKLKHTCKQWRTDCYIAVAERREVPDGHHDWGWRSPPSNTFWSDRWSRFKLRLNETESGKCAIFWMRKSA